VRAPDPLRELLERNLELRRYREVSDLDDAEIARLVVLAEKDARELLATQGYFAPQVRIAREPARAPPGGRRGARARAPRRRVGHRPSRATSPAAPIADAATQREGIRADWRCRAGQPFTQTGWDRAKAERTRRCWPPLSRRRISYSLADVDAARGPAKLGLRWTRARCSTWARCASPAWSATTRAWCRGSRACPGSVYDQEKIVQAQLRLSGSGYFDSAFIFVDPDPTPRRRRCRSPCARRRCRRWCSARLHHRRRSARDAGAHAQPRSRHRLARRHQAAGGDEEPYAQTEWTDTPDERGWRWSVLGAAKSWTTTAWSPQPAAALSAGSRTGTTSTATCTCSTSAPRCRTRTTCR
jgi:translocation and assembly module TamA